MSKCAQLIDIELKNKKNLMVNSKGEKRQKHDTPSHSKKKATVTMDNFLLPKSGSTRRPIEDIQISDEEDDTAYGSHHFSSSDEDGESESTSEANYGTNLFR